MTSLGLNAHRVKALIFSFNLEFYRPKNNSKNKLVILIFFLQEKKKNINVLAAEFAHSILSV